MHSKLWNFGELVRTDGTAATRAHQSVCSLRMMAQMAMLLSHAVVNGLGAACTCENCTAVAIASTSHCRT